MSSLFYQINMTIENPSVYIVKVEEEVSRPQFVEESKVENLASHCNRRKLEVVKCTSSDILIVARVADVRKRTGGRRHHCKS